MIRFLLFVLLAYGAWQGYTNYFQTTHWPPGILIQAAPIQEATNTPAWRWGRYTINPLATYKIDARVLSTRSYSDDIGPLDFALGWQEMSDSRVLDQLHITQFARFYDYRWSNGPPIDPQIIVRTSANTHLLPADNKILKQLKHIHEGALIHLEGYLVRAVRDDGWYWTSSLTREDSGAGACEVLWVTSVTVYPKAH